MTPANSSSSTTTATGTPGAFAPTRWTLVLRTRGETPEARAALSDLCASYWQPVFHFLRREGRTEDEARELTQDFYARILSGNGFAGATPERGRFRSFLLGALRHYLADRRDRDRAARRGGGQSPEPLDGTTETSPGLEIAATPESNPETVFDRQWAYAVLDRSLSTLSDEQDKAGRSPQFAVLKAWLVGDTPALSQSDAARHLGLSEGAVKVAIHRMRKRYRELVRHEVAQTVPKADDVDEELRYLIEVLSR